MVRAVLVAAAVGLCLSVAIEAQQGTSDLRGRVLDPQQAALPGASVTVRHQDSGRFSDTVSGPDGSIFRSAMEPGTYTVEATLQGFKKFERKDVRLEVGRTTQIEITLEVGGLEESVTVTAEAPLVDTT